MDGRQADEALVPGHFLANLGNRMPRKDVEAGAEEGCRGRLPRMLGMAMNALQVSAIVRTRTGVTRAPRAMRAGGAREGHFGPWRPKRQMTQRLAVLAQGRRAVVNAREGKREGLVERARLVERGEGRLPQGFVGWFAA